ncbi:MAG TPA: hypothetical protein VIP28_10890 [Nocardioides sp.]
MTRRILNAGLLVLATLGAVALVAALFLALVAPENTDGDPTDAPSGERPVPCAEDDRACNEWIDVQESE